MKISQASPQLKFNYSWPAEAAVIPALDRHFGTDAAKEFRAMRKTAAIAAKEQHFRTYAFEAKWELGGETKQLLSLQGWVAQDTGGAHPLYADFALVWDRLLNRETKLGAIFLRPGDFEALTRTSYCKKLDAERARKRQGWKSDLPEFNACPKYSELAISPADRAKNGRFDRIRLVASPYTAGPWVEGDYSIDIPVTRQLIAAIKPEYRASFEAQRQ